MLNHGYLTGEVYTCPHCGEKTEVYSRITGYYRPVQNWNDGKSQEFRDRKVYDIGRSRLTHSGPVDHAPTAAAAGAIENAPADEPAPESAELLLFATRTCPNCRQAEKLLNEAGIAYRKVMVEQNMDLAKEHGIRQAPTLIVGGENPEKLVGVGAIRKFITDSVKVR